MIFHTKSDTNILDLCSFHKKLKLSLNSFVVMNDSEWNGAVVCKKQFYYNTLHSVHFSWNKPALTSSHWRQAPYSKCSILCRKTITCPLGGDSVTSVNAELLDWTEETLVFTLCLQYADHFSCFPCCLNGFWKFETNMHDSFTHTFTRPL